MPPVKPRNPRAARARETRRRIVAAARDLFVEHGYGATVLPGIAARAGVSVQTIYFAFGNKRTLLKHVVDVAIAGDLEPVATLERPWFREALAAGTAETMLAAYVTGTGEVLHRVAPVLKVLETAIATDPEVAAMWPRDGDPRLAVVRRAAEALLGKPGARTGVTLEYATDLIYALLGPELYTVLVDRRGWSRERWREWAEETLRGQLCQPGPAEGTPSG